MSAENNTDGNSRDQPRPVDTGDASSDEELAQLNRGLVAEAQPAMVCIGLSWKEETILFPV